MRTQRSKTLRIIKVLPESLSARIAAGEVVERPASVVKELVENALDAGATRINVEIRNGGRSLIRVDDDGVGIPSSQMEIAFERFATSKIDDRTDLAQIETLGFRGEALPSIASVSDIEATSKTMSETNGSRLIIRLGQPDEIETHGRPQGTSLLVRNLFQNVPARMRFLTSQGAEVARIHQMVTRYALIRPDIAFTLNSDGSDRIFTTGQGDLKEAATAIYGTQVAGKFLKVDTFGDIDRLASLGYRVEGAVAAPSLTRGNRNYITIGVNGRWVYSQKLSFAIEQAYYGFLERRKFPVAILHITIPATDVDVNVHPAKTEVKFVRERLLFGIVQRSVREVLLELSPVPVFTTFDANYPATRQEKVPIADNPLWPESANSESVESYGKNPTVIADCLSAQVENSSENENHTPKAVLPKLEVVGQVKNTYIVAEGEGNVYLIDQHAAHERVLFEEIVTGLDQNQVASQQLLEPEVLELRPEHEDLYSSNADFFSQLGYSIEIFGPQTILIRSVPSAVVESPSESLLNALDSISAGGSNPVWRERLMASLACHAAVTAGRSMETSECEALVRRLAMTLQPHTCPHSRPTMIEINTSDLEREFRRA